MSQLTAEHITVAYNGQPVVKDVSLEVKAGDMLGLIGPNGAGKTTILRTLAGLTQPGTGRVLLNGQALQNFSMRERARQIAFVPQGEALAWPLAVEELVGLGRAAHRGWLLPLSKADKERVEWALERTTMTGLRTHPVDKLSGGERQRALIARALAQQAPVLLLDEPTAHLDIHHQLQVLDLVQSLVETEKLTVLIAIHDLALAAHYCQQLLLLKDGQVVASGGAEAVLTPEHLNAVFGVSGELYRNPFGQWALGINTHSVER